jgi:hypothetical protein
MARARDSVVLTLCDEVCRELSNIGIAAITDPAPHIDLSKVRRFEAFVVPGTIDLHPVTRGSNEERVDISICVVDRPASADIDRPLNTLHSIATRFLRRRLPHGVVIAVTPEHDLESWWKLRVFSGSVTLAVWIGVRPS